MRLSTDSEGEERGNEMLWWWFPTCRSWCGGLENGASYGDLVVGGGGGGGKGKKEKEKSL